MNLTSQSSEGPNAGGYFVNFNQDCSSLSVGSGSSYHLYSLGADDVLEEIYANHSGEDTWLVERLFSSSLVAVVTLSAPRKLKVCHFRKGTEICNYSYSNTILAVKLNRARLIVCLEESLYIHNIRDMKVLHTIRDTPPNPHGLCTFSASADNCFLAYPGSSTVGEVQIFDAVNLSSKTMIPAHESPLAALAFSSSGARLATASERGTVIRVFNVADGRKLFEFRRGVKRCVSISCLAFSTCGNYLCCSSNTETVHIFKLLDPTKELARSSDDESAPVPLPPADASSAPASANAANVGWMGWVADMVRGSAGYLPSQVADVLSQGRAFASARLPRSGLRSVIAITTIHKSLRLLVATADGYLYVYSLDAIEGGECSLITQHRLAIVAPNATSSNNATNPTNINKGISNSYAGALRGRDPAHMTDSEKFHEMSAATESPPRGGFKFDDDKEFPPMAQPASSAD